MLRIWRKHKVDKILKRAHNKGIVLAGLSAGSYCWFKKGISSSKYQIYNGLSLIKANNVCHYPKRSSKKRNKKRILEIIKKTKGVTIALEDCCAIEIVDDKYRILTSKKDAKAYKIYKKDGKIVIEIVKKEKEYKPIASLLYEDSYHF